MSATSVMGVADLLEVAREAGRAILGFYGTHAGLEVKEDQSPLTLADKASHQIILKRLTELCPDVPVISEESAPPPFSERREWTRFWLVDPLDGTKEFLKQTGEFTVNIGLVEDGVPSVGVVHAPAVGLSYWTDGGSAWMQRGGSEAEPVIAGRYEAVNAPVLVASRDHAGPAVARLVDAHPGAEFRSMGSSLKFCMVADGAADLYLRDVPTMEWDTAAAHAVVRAAGATLLRIDGEPLQYNKEELRNPGLVTFREGALPLLGSTGWKRD